LREILSDARQQMDDLLAYTRDSVDDFIRRVEHRSSLLIQSGHVAEEGRVWVVYEFRHLTFQEYLSALAVADGYYPGHSDDDTLTSVLEPHLDNPEWREVIPLAAMLAGRRAKSLIERLIDLCERPQDNSSAHRATPTGLITQCLVDSVPLPPPLIQRALLAVARASDVRSSGSSDQLRRSRHAELFQSITLNYYANEASEITDELSEVVDDIAEFQLFSQLEHPTANVLVSALKEQLANNDRATQALAAFKVVSVAFHCAPLADKHDELYSDSDQQAWLPREELTHELAKLLPVLLPLVNDPRPSLHTPAIWALVWLIQCNIVPLSLERSVMPRLFEVWHSSPYDRTRHFAAWGLSELPLFERTDSPFPPPTQELLGWLTGIVEGGLEAERANKSSVQLLPAFAVAYYWRQPWSDAELATLIASSKAHEKNAPLSMRLLKAIAPVSTPQF
jgi:hypothetical protein